MPDQVSVEEKPNYSFSQWDFWVGVLPLIASAPMLLYQAAALWSRPHMRFFPLTLLAVFLLVALAFRHATESKHPIRWWTAILLFVSSSAAYLYSIWIDSPWFAHLAIVGVFAAWALGRFGQRHWAGIAGWTVLLGSTLQLPWGWDLGIIHWLETLATWCTTRALDALAIPCLQNGSVIETRGLQLVANEVCGGPGSLYAVFSFAIALLIARHRSFLVAIATLLLVPVWTLFGNFLRLFTILIAEEYWDRNMANGWDYFLLNAATIVLVLLITWLSTVLFFRLFEPIPVADAEFGPVFSGLNKMFCWPQPDPYEESLPEDEWERKSFLRLKQEREAQRRIWPVFSWTTNHLVYWTVRFFAILLIVGSALPSWELLAGGFNSLNFGVPRMSVEQVEAMASEETFPASLDGGWKRIGFFTEHRSPRSRFGEFSVAWRYQAGERQFTASVDFPFLGWHDPAAERALQGWKTEEASTTADSDWPWCEAELENELGGKAYVLYSLFDQQSKPYVNTSAVGARRTQSTTAVTYQFQLFSESGTELTRSDRAAMREMFQQLREIAKGLANGTE